MNIASYIDHTLLKPDTPLLDVHRICDEAKEYEFAAVCVPPHYVKDAKKRLEDSAVAIATVIGFPFGYGSTASKVAEIKKALADGADELDMVHNLCALKNDDWEYLAHEVAQCLQPIRLHDKILKVIIESGILTDAEIVKSCELYARHKVDYVKTSTGYAEQGASLHAVRLMHSNLPSAILIKASGGIRNFAFAKELVDAGASRIGTSAGITIVKESLV